jgi:uncharacterized protein
MTISSFIKRFPVITYFTLTFAISWSIVLIVIGPGGIPDTTEQVEQLFPIALLAMLLGPTVAGILLTGIVYGRAGLRELESRLFRWRVGVRWYAVALLATPLSVLAVLLPLSLVSPEFVPDVFTERFTTEETVTLVLLGIGVGLFGGFLEELGWTGFAVPDLRHRYGVLTTGLIVGVLWGAWHFPINAWMSGTFSGSLPLALFVPLYFFSGVVQLTAFRILMVWVYDRTGESLLAAILMHASLIASTSIVFLPQVTGVSFLVFVLAVAAALWVVVAAVYVTTSGQLTPQPNRGDESYRRNS